MVQRSRRVTELDSAAVSRLSTDIPLKDRRDDLTVAAVLRCSSRLAKASALPSADASWTVSSQPSAAVPNSPSQKWSDVEVALPPDPRRPRSATTVRPAHGEQEPICNRACKKETATERYQRLLGLNGETCYILITDLKSGAWRVSIRTDKRPALDFFRNYISRYGSASLNRTVRFDNGGELGGNSQVHDLFRNAGYKIELTGPDSSSKIGAVERPHRIIADAVRTMLHSAGMPAKFWPYALQHFVVLANCILRGDRKLPPVTICTGKRPNFKLLRIWGCRVYALPPGDCPPKLDVHARQGVFLGYKDTFHHALYYNFDSHQVKTS